MRALTTRQKAHLRSWDGTVVRPRRAATAVLLRTVAGRQEVFLMRRQSTMAFAAGMWVFPGGGVHESDGDPEVPWAGPTPEQWGRRLGCAPRIARALVVAAVRETFEETGVLLAGTEDGDLVSDTGRFERAAVRVALEERSVGFGEFLTEQRLCVRTDALAPWAHWITPDFEPARYDTHFFLARLPTGQRIEHLATEADRGEWVGLRRAHRAGTSGEFGMMPPTRHTLRQLLDLAPHDPFEAASSREVRTIAPRLVEADGEQWLDGPDQDEL